LTKPQESRQTLAKGLFRMTHAEQRAAVPPFLRAYWEKLAKKNSYYNTELMQRWADGLEREMVLEAGCGQSSTLCRRSQPLLKLVGLDPLRSDLVMFEGAWARVQAVLEDLPFADGTLSGIYCDSVFEHIADPPRVMREFYRVLKPGGRVIINTNSVFNPFMFPNKFLTVRQREWIKVKCRIESEGTYPAPYRMNTKRRMVRTFRRVGFEDIHIYRWGVPAMYRPRWLLTLLLLMELLGETPLFCGLKHRLMGTCRKPE
jgi:ubiquinone/menaquinone biosynthesis C-methylase UbiE